MLRRTLVFIVCLFFTGTLLAQTKSPVEGVWRVAEIVTTGANAVNNSKPQPGLWIFTRGHYSQMITNGTQPRKTVQYKVPNQPTDAEKLARYEQWQPFAANAGTYEIKGSTLTRRLIVAKNVEVQTGPPIVSEFKLEGNNTLWLITKGAAGQPASETRMRLTRVE
jgi:hypothetical protein